MITAPKDKKKVLWILIGISLLLIVSVVFFLTSERLQWRAQMAADYLKGVIEPVGTLAPAEDAPLPGQGGVFAPFTSEVTPTAKRSAPEAGSLPAKRVLTPPEFIKERDLQGWNNCGPATLALALRMYGWKGDQGTIAAVIKPKDLDKNVNIEELAEYARAKAGLRAVIRVAGDLNRLEGLVASGYPVIVEEAFTLDKSFWPNDDRWSSHFVLVTGYDRNSGHLTTQDAYYGPNVEVEAQKLLRDWQAFNYVYLVLYPVQEEKQVAGLLGDDWSESSAYQAAVITALDQTRRDRRDLFAWFNLGSSYLGLGQNENAWLAFNEARKIGLPQRMLRYQFGPFQAAYATGRTQDLKELVEYALKITSNSEEVLYWQGKLYMMEKQPSFARKSYLEALAARPNDAAVLQALQELK